MLCYNRQTIKKLSWVIFLLFSAPTFPVGNGQVANSLLPLPPRVSIWGSSGTNTFGEGDAMIPIWGNLDQTFYGDISAKYGDDRAWFVSGGLGGRKIILNNTILGAYLFTDYNKTPDANYFTVLSPGVELMTNTWDGHLNGYVPVGKKSKSMGIFPGSQLGMPNTSFFRGHTQYDYLFNSLENVGSGMDLEIGHTFNTFSYLKRTRAFAAGYYFAPKDAQNVRGIQAGFEMPLNYKWASVEVRDSYDNLNHNTFVLTLSFTFGGLDKTGEPNIHDRMLDRIPRHLGNLNNGDGIPSQNVIVNTGQTTITEDNIWFFQQGASTLNGVTFDQCTFENPCIGINQNVINSIDTLNKNALFYFAPGNYFPIASPAPSAGPLLLNNGQTFWGRTSNYKNPASGGNRAIFNGVLQLSGNNTLDSVQIVNDSVDEALSNGFQLSKTGVHILPNSNGNIILHNVNIQVNNNDLNRGAISIFADGNSDVLISDSTLTAISNAAISFDGGENIAIVGNNNFIINNSKLVTSVTGDVPAYNIYNQTSSSQISINNSALVASSTGSGAAGNIFLNMLGSAVNINGTQLTAISNGVSNPSGAQNVILTQNSSAVINDSVLNAINNSLTGTATNVNIFLGTIAINNSTLNATDNNGFSAIGIHIGLGNVSLNNSVINVREFGQNINADANGIRNEFSGSNLTIKNSSINVIANSNSIETSGISLLERCAATISDSNINLLQQGNGGANAIIAKVNSSVSISNTNVTAHGTSAAFVRGIRAETNSSVTLNNVKFQLTNTNGPVVGAATDATSTMTILNSGFNIQSQSGQAAGISNDGTMTITNTNFLINGNGTSVFNSGANAPARTGGSCFLNGSPC